MASIHKGNRLNLIFYIKDPFRWMRHHLFKTSCLENINIQKTISKKKNKGVCEYHREKLIFGNFQCSTSAHSFVDTVLFKVVIVYVAKLVDTLIRWPYQSNDIILISACLQIYVINNYFVTIYFNCICWTLGKYL